jgi:hypothetical protein
MVHLGHRHRGFSLIAFPLLLAPTEILARGLDREPKSFFCQRDQNLGDQFHPSILLRNEH